jgi:hypothetical protein
LRRPVVASCDDLMKKLTEATVDLDGPDISFHAVGLYAKYLVLRHERGDDLVHITFEDISGSVDDEDAMIELFREGALVALLPEDDDELPMVLFPDETDAPAETEAVVAAIAALFD